MNNRSIICTLPCIALMLALCGGCFRQEVRTAEFDVPGLETAQDAEAMREAFREDDGGWMPGVYEVTPNIEQNSVVIQYNSDALRRMNLEYRIAKHGYRADSRPPAEPRPDME
ncbi:hypothetical protein [Kiritimatiella glycovorans]|uniref:Uncharacterized protein n=1 Tax=Kiritimatiella glycovorans TaxID=1307763 RepID=A0A0G3EI58_9BACT|nr:hypothetical protein [Kiritimatiella glycovorans]AKJ64500.1 hypothetical protein L21SP4_01252 [Kiritimatiella glycovorans]